MTGNHNQTAKHVLIVPSEEFQPAYAPLAGIFQLHQARILRQHGYRVGILSISQKYSVPMLLKAAIGTCIGVRHPRLRDATLTDVLKILYKKTFAQNEFVSIETRHGFPLACAEGLYIMPPLPHTNHTGWVRAGLAAYQAYVNRWGRPDLIHAHNCDPGGLLAHTIFRKHGIPYVITEHSSYYHRGLIPPGLYPKIRACLSSAREIAVVSPALRDELVRQLGPCAQRAHWIPNVVDSDFEDTPVLDSLASDADFAFLSVGSLIPLKGHADLLRAFANNFRGNSTVSLQIAGEGELRSALTGLAEELKVSRQVQFLGNLSRDETLRQMDKCNCLVLPSHYETFGVVLIEALTRGKPVVATRCGGPDCFVTRENGLLVPPCDIKGLGDAMDKMRTRITDYAAATIRSSALARFGREPFSQLLDEFYDRALATNNEMDT
jgi:glycosyltransferase involved in cell wall biosynthesis